MMIRNGLVCNECGGWMEEDQLTGVNECDTCGLIKNPDGSVDKSNCENEED